LVVLCSVVAVLTHAAAVFLGFPVTSLAAAVVFGSGFSGLAVFLVVIIFSCLGTFVSD
jgi:hypothetical protein